tara:strand:- start:1106 stop:1891 length:786 start_codon:yes stop_codon:yes gene_type:complete
MIDVLKNGEWENKDPSELKTDSNYFAHKKGVYETIKVEKNKIFFVEEHLQRLFDSASNINLSIRFKKDEIKNQINQVINKLQTPNQLIRLILYPQKLLVFSETLEINSKIYKGVKTMTFLAKRENPEIKSTENKIASRAWSAAVKSNCFESILIDKKENIYEGSRSNFFWVKNNTIFTRENDILPGITRQIILKNSPLNISYDILNVKNLHTIDESFITQTSCGIVPVKQINNLTIGKSSPGKKTSELINLYNQWSEKSDK